MKSDYLNLPPVDFIQYLANHRGGHAFQLKAMCSRWLNAEKLPRETCKETHLRLAGEVRELRAKLERKES